MFQEHFRLVAQLLKKYVMDALMINNNNLQNIAFNGIHNVLTLHDFEVSFKHRHNENWEHVAHLM